jgi:hypothetical protein
MQFLGTPFVIAYIATVCNALDLLLWNAGGCRDGTSVQCINPGYNYCCLGGAPFCESGNCVDCRVGNDIYTFQKSGCRGNSFASCRAAVGDGCCRSAGSGNICAIVAYVGNAGAKKMDPQQCEATVRPNKLVYTNRNGTEQSIHIPTGAFETVVQHFVNEDWDALAEFPAWGKFIHVTLVTNF